MFVAVQRHPLAMKRKGKRKPSTFHAASAEDSVVVVFLTIESDLILLAAFIRLVFFLQFPIYASTFDSVATVASPSREIELFCGSSTLLPVCDLITNQQLSDSGLLTF
jgi:hypothetical protein